MADFYPVKKAVETTGKSESTIKRMLTSIKSAPKSPDRKHLRPTVEQYKQHKKLGTPFQWEISQTLLQQRYPEAFETAVQKQRNPAEPEFDALTQDSRYVGLLEKQIGQLQESNDELRKQNSSLTSSLTELTDRVTQMLGHYQANVLGPASSPRNNLPPSNSSKRSTQTNVDMDESLMNFPNIRGRWLQVSQHR